MNRFFKTIAAVSVLAGASVFLIASVFYNPRPYFDVAYYAQGASIGDGMVLNDISFTASNAAVSSASYSFTQNDVGKLALFWDRTPVSLTISTTSGSNVVTLSSATGTHFSQHIYSANLPAGEMICRYQTAVIVELCNNTEGVSPAATATASGTAATIVNPYPTTIVSVSGGVATLGTAPTNSITGGTLVFGTDSQPAIQAAEVAAEAAGGGTVKLGSARYVTSGTILWGGGASLVGDGRVASILSPIYLSNGTGGNGGIPVILSRYGVSGCTTSIAQQNGDATFDEFQIDGGGIVPPAYGVSDKGISFPCGSKSIVHHLWVKDTPATCIATDNSITTIIESNIIARCGWNANGQPGGNGIGEGLESLGTTELYKVLDNTSTSVQHVAYLMEEQQATVSNANVIIEGNSDLRSYSTDTIARACISDGNTASLIVGNNCVGVAQSGDTSNGIAMASGTLTNQTGAEPIIADNMIYGENVCILYSATSSGNPPGNARTIISNNKARTCYAAGIEIVTGSVVTIDGVAINGNMVAASGQGLYLQGTSPINHLSVQDNTWINNGANQTTYHQAAIVINAPVAGFTEEGDISYDLSGNQFYSIAINTGIAVTNALVKENNFTGIATAAFYTGGGTMTGIVEGNVGFNPPTMTGCTPTAIAGGPDAAKVTIGVGAACSLVVTPYGTANIIAPHGYLLTGGFDTTTSADAVAQTGASTTTLTLGGAFTNADVLNFAWKGW